MSFPNFQGKHARDAMFSPKDFLAYQKKIGRTPKWAPPESMMICYQRSLLEHVAKNHRIKEVEDFWGRCYLLPETKNKVGIIGKFGIGSPIAVTVLEELIAYGVKRFISIGTAGTLQRDIPIGSIVVCDRAIRDEGTSHHYLKPSKYIYPSQSLTKKMIVSLRELELNFCRGTSWTIDAPYRETVAEAKRYQDEGVATVEMEASALFAVAKYRRVPLASMFTISDSLADLTWTPKFHSRATTDGLENIYQAALHSLK